MKGIVNLVVLAVILSGTVSCGPDLLRRYDKPMTLEQAKTDIRFPLPASCSNIYYAVYGDWQAYVEVVRFQAAVTDCIKHVDVVTAWDNATYKRTNSYSRGSIKSVQHQGCAWLDPVAWFDPDKITNGIYAGQEGSHLPQMWIDEDRGLFYFRETD